jgi:hypothetical protein
VFLRLHIPFKIDACPLPPQRQLRAYGNIAKKQVLKLAASSQRRVAMKAATCNFQAT